MYKMFFRISAVFLIMVFIVSCASAESGPKFGTGTLKQAVYNLNKAPSNPNSDTGTTGRVDRFVDLPLLLWPSFEYRRIPRVVEKDKVEHCLITESEGAQLQPGTKVEIIDEARCFYVRLNSKDGIPRSYTTTFAQIRVIETGEEGWTWSKAIEFDKK